MLFKEIIGQEILKRKLVSGVLENHVPHTQLFLGNEGSGNLALALAYAQYINCENKSDNDSCGKCPSCVKAGKMIHPDIYFSYPVYKAKTDRPALSSDFISEWRQAVLKNPYQNVEEWLDFIDSENKQGNITADECRDIIRKLNLKTFESEYKILIIWMAEYLQKEGNLLLKLLEEPTEETILILIAENRDLILPTIISRSQIVSIPPIENQTLLEALMQRHGLDRKEAARINRQASGNYSRALREITIEQDDNTAIFIKWMQLLYSQNTEVMSWVDDFSKAGREKQKSLFRYALEFIRECVILQQMGEEYSRLHDEEIKLGKWLAQKMQPDDWQRMVELLNEAHYHTERNAHPKMLLLHLSLQLQKLITQKKLTLAH